MIRGNSMQFGNFKFLFLFLFFSISSFSQTLEDQVYNALDTFVANANTISLKVLNQKEKEFAALASNQDEKLAMVILYCNKGSFEMKQNLQKEAIISYEKSWSLFSKNKLSNYDITEYCLKPLGTLYTKSGNYALAENIIKKYIFIAEKDKNEATIISGYINLSIVYKTISNHKTAIDLLQKAKKLNTSSLQNKRIQEELTVNFIGLKKYNIANELLENNKVRNDFQTLKANAFIALKQNNFDLAVDYFEKAKNILFQKKEIEAREIAKLYIEEASIYSYNRNSKKAYSCLSNALQTLLPFNTNTDLPNKNVLYAENTFLDIFDGFAHLENNTIKKMAWYNLSFYVNELIYDNLTSQETQILQQIENRKRTEKCIDALWESYQKNHSITTLELAYQYAEKSKNTVLKDRNKLKTLLEQHPKNKDLQLQNNLLSKQESLINEYIRLQITNENPNRIITLNNELTTLTFQLKEVNNIVQKSFKNNEKQIKTASLLKKLENDKAQMLYYFWAKEHFYYFYFTTTTVIWKRISLNETTTALIQNYIHFFDDANAINEDVTAFSSTAHSLFQLLELDTLEKHKNLVIVPDGLFYFLSFDALTTKKTNTANFNKIPFLIHQNKIAYQTNATFYIDNIVQKKNNKIVGFFPVFKTSNAYLEYSIEEAKALKKNNAVLFMNEEANRDNFKQNTSQYSIIHLSTHGTSGNFSSPATLVFYDDVMLVNELYGLENCNPDLVVLSACESGIGKLQKGEGTISIARAFQYAGAKNVLFSLWKINDYATAQLMTNFYSNYSNNHSFFESNYNAKIDYLKDSSIANAKKSPYYWSAFVYYGSIDTNATHYTYYIALGCIILLFLFFYVRRISQRKHKIH